MIQVEHKTINDVEFIHTYSDIGMMIERDGVKYSDAYDPIQFEGVRVYTETDKKVDNLDESEPLNADTTE